MEVKLFLSNTNEVDSVAVDNNELEKLYQIYTRVQSGDKAALNELFKTVDSKQVCRLDEISKEYRLSHMDSVLDSQFVLDREKNMQEEEWIDSVNSNVTFQFPCLNKMLYKKKKKFLSKTKNTGYENGQKIKNSSCSKFYDGQYDISDFNELMYETIIEVFTTKTDDDSCLTLDHKKNINPICNGLSLLQNISYFVSRKINKRAKNGYMDIFDTGSYNEESNSDTYFDKYALNEYFESEGGTSRLTMYAEYLEWIRRNDIYRLFKTNAYGIKAIIETIMRCKDTFIIDTNGDMKTGSGMCLIKQELLQKMINDRHNINIEQENISIDLRIIEQRLLDHLFYSLNYKIRNKAENNHGDRSRCFLYELDRKAYEKIFSRASYMLYNESIKCLHTKDYNEYFCVLEKYENMVMKIILSEKGKKRYDMANLMMANYDLVDDSRQTILNLADTIRLYYQKKEEDYEKNKLKSYKIHSLKDWNRGFWEAILKDDILKIKLWSSEDVKNPIRCEMGKSDLIVYCGCTNYYFCDIIKKICYRVPKNRRIISRSNKEHEIIMLETD